MNEEKDQVTGEFWFFFFPHPSALIPHPLLRPSALLKIYVQTGHALMPDQAAV
jgi:hypothetical protein